MEASSPEQQNYFEAFIKAAQYLAGLTAQQDIWRETGKVLVNFFGAEVGAVEEKGANGETARHRWAFSEGYLSRTDLEAETREAIAEVLECGFLSARIIFTPDPLSIACFPITWENQVVAVMVVGHAMPEPLPRELLNVYLAVAGLVGTTVERLASERELWRHRQQLQEKIAERRQAERALKRSEERMTTLNRIANIFLTIPDKEMYGEVLEVVLQAMKSKFGIFGFIEANGDLVIPSMTREIWNECQVPDKSIVFPQNTWGTSLWGRSIGEKKALFSDGPFHTPDGHVHIDTFLAVPIIFGNETIGILSVANKENGYTEEDQRLLESIAGYISPILNARLQRDRKEQERKRAEEKMLRSDQRLRLHSEQSPLGFLEWDDNFHAIEWNAACERIFGYTREEAIGRHAKDLILPIEVHELVDGIYHSLMSQTGGQHSINKNVTKDGRIIICEWFNTTLINKDGKAIGVASVCRDITEQKRMEVELTRYREHLEEQVRERTAELEAANKELEAFAYSVSHDLRAPLRHIDGFLELLQSRIAASHDEKGRHYMAVISEAARKMGRLIDDLLSFSRMGRYEMTQIQVDLGGLVQEVIQEIAPEAKGRKVLWRIRDLPVVTGDAAMLRIVLINLISNAIKFTRPREQAEIEIGCTGDRETEPVVFVSDNGVGFDMAFVDKLFSVFQRLHHADEFEGTGIGLANVRRIISRHGGKTWAEGKVNQGATFFFSLPRKVQ